MKYVAIFILATLLSGCCSKIDCDSPILMISVRLVDETGKDLVFDLGVPVDSISFQTGGSKLYISRQRKYLAVDIVPSQESYTISYKDRSTDVTISQHIVDSDGCCGPYYDVAGVTSVHGEAPTESPDGFPIYVIPL